MSTRIGGIFTVARCVVRFIPLIPVSFWYVRTRLRSFPPLSNSFFPSLTPFLRVLVTLMLHLECFLERHLVVSFAIFVSFMLL